MKKIMTSPEGNGRKAYEKPNMKVDQMDTQHTLLTGSGEKLDIIEDEKNGPLTQARTRPTRRGKKGSKRRNLQFYLNINIFEHISYPKWMP